MSGTLALTAGTGHNGNLAALDANGNPTDSGLSKDGIVPTSRTVNNKQLSSDVVLTGTDIMVSDSDPTKIDAALSALDSRVTVLETVMPPHSVVFNESLVLIIPAGMTELYTYGKRDNFAVDFRNYFPHHDVWGYTINTSEPNVYGIIMAYNNNDYPNGFVLFNRNSDVSATGELWRDFYLATSRNVRLFVTLSAKQAKPAAFDILLNDSSVPVYQYRGPDFTAGENRNVTTDFFLVAAGDGRIRIRGAGVTEFSVTYVKMETD